MATIFEGIAVDGELSDGLNRHDVLALVVLLELFAMTVTSLASVALSHSKNVSSS
jgi:hypothetical protein